MDTAEIEVFLALAEELHFGRTAERRIVDQRPAVRQRMAEMRHLHMPHVRSFPVIPRRQSRPGSLPAPT